MSIFSRLPNDIIMNIIKIETDRIDRIRNINKIKFNECMNELLMFHQLTLEQREEYVWDDLYYENLWFNIKYRKF